MNTKINPEKQIRFLESEVKRLQKVNEALMDRVERSTDQAGSSYSLFESNLLLQNKLNEHIGKVVHVNHQLQRQIAENKKTEEALRSERNFVNAVLDAAGALIIVLDISGNIIRFNRSCEKTTGYTFDEIKNTPFWVLLLDEEKEKVKNIFYNLREGRDALNSGENYWVSKSGEKRLISWSNTTVNDEKGKVQYIVGIGIDVTEHREADEKLKLYRRIFLASSDGIAITDPNGNVIERNPSHKQFLKYQDNEIIGKPASTWMNSKDGQRIFESISVTNHFRGEVQMFDRDGKMGYMDLSIFPIFNEKEDLMCYVGMGRDITQNKLNQEALAAKLRYEKGLAEAVQALMIQDDESTVLKKALIHLLEAAQVGRVYIFENFEDHENGLCTRQRIEVCAPGVSSDASNPALQHLPYKNIFSNWREILSGDKHLGGPASKMPPEIQKLLKPGGTKSILILPLKKDESWYGFIGFDDVLEEREWTEGEIRLLKTAADMIGGYLGRRQALEALSSSEERFRMLVENSNNVIYSLNVKGEITYLSPKFEEYSGYSFREYLGKPVDRIINTHDASLFLNWLNNEAKASEHKLENFPSRIKDKTGKWRWFVSNASVVKDEEGKVVEVIGVAHDITEMKKILEDLEDANRHLRETQTQLVQSEKMASLGQLVAGIAHEINTPIGSVSSMHNTLVRAIDKLRTILEDDCLKEVTNCRKIPQLINLIDDANNVIKNGTSRVTTIVRRLRSFARLDEAEMKKADIHEALEDTLTLVHHELKHNIKVIRNYGEIPAISCYISRLNQVFVNILVNAKQAIRDKGEITITTLHKNEKVYIEFSDTGVGIKRENLEKIFDPGFTTKGVGVGTGLGLSICYQIMQDHHGEIKVESEVGKGTTFTLIIPDNLDEILGIS